MALGADNGNGAGENRADLPREKTVDGRLLAIFQQNGRVIEGVQTLIHIGKKSSNIGSPRHPIKAFYLKNRHRARQKENHWPCTAYFMGHFIRGFPLFIIF